MRHKPHRKRLKKIRRLAAAVASAAVMSAAVLPVVSAAQLPDTAAPEITEKAPDQTAPAQNVRQAKHHDEAQRQDSDSDSHRKADWNRAEHRDYSPVEVVRNNAAYYGFDADNDSFSLLSKSDSKAIVQVRRMGGQTFKVDLEQSGDSWVITTIRGIGNMKYPATYIPASMFSHHVVVAAPVAAGERIIFTADNYASWNWSERTYPSDMHFGIYTANPSLVESGQVLPDAVVKALAAIDYTRQFVFYADLGSVPPKGYGIGIEKVAQTGNTLLVTVRTASPGLTTSNLTFTKNYDYITIDRSAVDFAKPVHVRFITPDGQALSGYTFLPQ